MLHTHDCDCIRCRLASGYVECAALNLELANMYQPLEDEAQVIGEVYAQSA
jgi:hypothetical protein